MINLRPYQLAAIAAYRQSLVDGITRGVIVLPTGCGKTMTALALAKDMGKRTLWLAHREELISQPIKALKHVWPEMRPGIVKAERNEYTRDFVFASIQTATRDMRLAQLVERDFGLIVCDEAHHYTADSYSKVLSAMGCFREASPVPVLGLTATPERGDGHALDRIFEQVVYQYHLDQAIKDGYLAPPRQIVRRIAEADFTAIKSRMGDFAQDDLEQVMLKGAVVNGVCDAIVTHAANRRALVFTVGVDQAKAIAARLNELGHAASSVDGEMPSHERARRLKDFADGKIKAIANCAVLTEGFDDPGVDCVVVARPTRSKTLYIQIVGRGLRLAPLKSDCLILDIVGATGCHNLIQAPIIFGDLCPQDPAETKRLATDAAYNPDQSREYWLQRYRAQVGGLPGESRSVFRWVQSPNGILALGVGQYGTVRLVPSGQDWSIDVVGNKQGGAARIPLSSEPVTLALGQGIAEDYVRRCGATMIANGRARWRDESPSEAQLKALERWRIPFDREHMTRGQAADMLTAKMSASTSHDAATEKQIGYLRRLGVDVAEGITKREAGKLISQALKQV